MVDYVQNETRYMRRQAAASVPIHLCRTVGPVQCWTQSSEISTNMWMTETYMTIWQNGPEWRPDWTTVNDDGHGSGRRGAWDRSMQLLVAFIGAVVTAGRGRPRQYLERPRLGLSSPLSARARVPTRWLPWLARPPHSLRSGCSLLFSSLPTSSSLSHLSY